MSRLDNIGLCGSNGSVEGNAFQSLWGQVCRDSHEREQQWIRGLRAAGIKAAHPDDGWVNRKDNTVSFQYPQFNDGVKDGDLIALGWPDKYRIVRVTKATRSDKWTQWTGRVDYGAWFEPWMRKAKP